MSIQQNQLEKVDEGLIMLYMNGDQTPDSIRATYEDMMDIIATMPGARPAELIDASDMGSHTMAVESLATDLIPISPVRRVAITETTTELKITINRLFEVFYRLAIFALWRHERGPRHG